MPTKAPGAPRARGLRGPALKLAVDFIPFLPGSLYFATTADGGKAYLIPAAQLVG
jgi:hypothetical protein